MWLLLSALYVELSESIPKQVQQKLQSLPMKVQLLQRSLQISLAKQNMMLLLLQS